MIDTLLFERERTGRPIQIGLVGAGMMGRMTALHLLTPPPGMRLAAVVSRTADRARRALLDSGVVDPRRVSTAAALEDAIREGKPAFADDDRILTDAESIDVIVEVTGTIDAGLDVTLRAFEAGKHVVLGNAELDSTLGPALKRRADVAGVTYTAIDGDEPGVAMNLLRYVRTLGLTPVAAGNLKGMLDRYRTPETQREFAAKLGQNPAIVTSFADGTKLSMELTILANATGFRVARRGMIGPACSHVREVASRLPAEAMLDGGIVDYTLGAEPHTGAFVVVHEEHPEKRKYLGYLKMGDGPFYVFYTPYHLPHIQLASTIGRAVLADDPTVTPIGGPVCEVTAVAKRDLAPGDVLDGVGGFTCYGVIDDARVAARKRMLPMGLSHGCRVVKAVSKDAPLTYDDVSVPPGRQAEKIHAECTSMVTGEK